MKYCSKCGNANSDESLFCASCGTPLEQAPAAPTLPPEPAQPEPAYAAPTYEAPAAPVAPTYEAPSYNAAYTPQQPAAPTGEVKNTATLWLILNIVATVFCCCPGGIFSIIGIILAGMGMGSYKNGDYEDMKKKSKISMIMFIIGIILGLIGLVVWIILLATSAITLPPPDEWF